jgi:predicted Na+-dependent transporter
MEFSKYLSAAIAAALLVVSVELLAEVILRGLARPAMVLVGLAATVLLVSALASHRAGRRSTPYW